MIRCDHSLNELTGFAFAVLSDWKLIVNNVTDNIRTTESTAIIQLHSTL